VSNLSFLFVDTLILTFKKRLSFKLGFIKNQGYWEDVYQKKIKLVGSCTNIHAKKYGMSKDERIYKGPTLSTPQHGWIQPPKLSDGI